MRAINNLGVGGSICPWAAAPFAKEQKIKKQQAKASRTLLAMFCSLLRAT